MIGKAHRFADLQAPGLGSQRPEGNDESKIFLGTTSVGLLVSKFVKSDGMRKQRVMARQARAEGRWMA